MHDEPVTRGTVWFAFREAAEHVWGEDGLRSILERLPEDARAAEGALVGGLGWVPTRWLLAWLEGTFDGPAERDEAAYQAYLDCTLDLSFGRIRRALLKIATPPLLAQRAADLWRHDHSHGTIVIERLENRVLQGTLADHPFTETPLGRASITEVLRYLLSLARARNVRASHQLDPAARLAIRFTWE